MTVKVLFLSLRASDRYSKYPCRDTSSSYRVKSILFNQKKLLRRSNPPDSIYKNRHFNIVKQTEFWVHHSHGELRFLFPQNQSW